MWLTIVPYSWICTEDVNDEVHTCWVIARVLWCVRRLVWAYQQTPGQDFSLSSSKIKPKLGHCESIIVTYKHLAGNKTWFLVSWYSIGTIFHYWDQHFPNILQILIKMNIFFFPIKVNADPLPSSHPLRNGPIVMKDAQGAETNEKLVFCKNL